MRFLFPYLKVGHCSPLKPLNFSFSRKLLNLAATANLYFRLAISVLTKLVNSPAAENPLPSLVIVPLSPVSCLLNPASRLLSPVSCLLCPFSRLLSSVSRLSSPVFRLPSHVSCLLSPSSVSRLLSPFFYLLPLFSRLLPTISCLPLTYPV